MKKYHKIDTVFARDPSTNYKTLLRGVYSQPAFEFLENNEWEWTEKVDGTNIRVMVKPEEQDIEFRGKSDNATIPVPLMKSLEGIFLPLRERLLETFPDGACLYGEGYGAKIQKGGGNYRKDQSFVLFDIRVGHWWLERQNVFDIATDLWISVVPVVGSGNLHEMVKFVENGFKSCWGDFPAEGVIAKPKVELFTRSGQRVITKLKTKDFV